MIEEFFFWGLISLVIKPSGAVESNFSGEMNCVNALASDGLRKKLVRFVVDGWACGLWIPVKS